ncbi:hypothetical protein [Halopiger xanaduensis]|uniref:Ba3-type terminal oxidase subunit CbaD n=1 Tax=Halopiger xanaduensis (strain DSM 18323 / JCM 14033 / SH-6) TaxID=797210 RepID=F8D6H9_HALXS|nr:hypothetical protein [Halopiger xanaduensis]AEH36568.1 hypothetical protein Halxa_1941 [Halopiger xanaduensis SH-6]
MSSATESTKTDRARDMGADEPDIVRELGHDEYDPIGTLILIAIYFAILVLLWLFMYFVEFLGNGPTVVGSLLTVVGLA